MRAQKRCQFFAARQFRTRLDDVGGATSAPIVADVHLPAMAPVGLLMGVAGYILDICPTLGSPWLSGMVAVRQ